MHTEIAVEILKTGETLRIEQVTPPDEERESQILPFLGHKPPNYRAHIEAAFADACDDLETRFTIGLLDNQVVGNIMTVESGGVGIFGHVFTREDQRRKGICQKILGHLMADFRARGGHILLLGTGYQSAAYWIYHSFGFRDWQVGHPGLMRYANPDEPDFEARFFAPSPSRPAAARWKHWPLVSLMASIPGPVALRSLTFGIRQNGLLEGPYCQFLYDQKRDPERQAVVLESETGAVTAMATRVPDARWRGDVALLDLFAHPNVGPEALRALLAALPPAAVPVQCFADPNDAAKLAALEAMGFQKIALLPGQFRVGDERRDAWLTCLSA